MFPNLTDLSIGIKVAIGAAFIAAVFMFGYMVKGNIDTIKIQKQELAIKDLTAKLNNALADVRIEYVTKEKIIYVTGTTIAAKTDEWVDSRIKVNEGLITHHNAAVDNVELPTEIPKNVMNPTDITLADYQRIVASNYTTANALRQQVLSLQAVVRVCQGQIEKQK